MKIDNRFFKINIMKRNIYERDIEIFMYENNVIPSVFND